MNKAVYAQSEMENGNSFYGFQLRIGDVLQLNLCEVPLSLNFFLKKILFLWVF